MELEKIIDECAETTKSKGFDTSMLTCQMLLIASEAAEAMLELSEPEDNQLFIFAEEFTTLMDNFENFRRTSGEIRDGARVIGSEGFIEELADIQIRLCSFIGDQNLTDEFLRILKEKMEKNKARPYLHGKSF